MTDTEPERKAPLDLWRIARAFLIALHALFGDPAQIAQRICFRRKEYETIARWVRAGEMLLRRLLLIEAAALQLAPTPVRARVKRARVRKLHAFHLEAPETWRVSFHVIDRGRRAAGHATPRTHAPGASSPAGAFPDAFPLALRCEALLRAYNDPAPYARRLARRLARQPQRAAAILAHTPDTHHVIPREDVDAVTSRAAACWAPLAPDSS
ncbi:MAG TPA: hypothetical protein VEA80_14340 [Vitreimonas sp.]|uniref:hypothetical protein n=1 Tax=Vitreimonas sp. TaxID=3069702 RepID=UPI002D64B13C|nr:hypothetical protein [Vitreimonas sp.]HYD88650.1 hypothetical protein [Vitreimonas sp.]